MVYRILRCIIIPLPLLMCGVNPTTKSWRSLPLVLIFWRSSHQVAYDVGHCQDGQCRELFLDSLRKPWMDDLSRRIPWASVISEIVITWRYILQEFISQSWWKLKLRQTARSMMASSNWRGKAGRHESSTSRKKSICDKCFQIDTSQYSPTHRP